MHIDAHLAEIWMFSRSAMSVILCPLKSYQPNEFINEWLWYVSDIGLLSSIFCVICINANVRYVLSLHVVYVSLLLVPIRQAGYTTVRGCELLHGKRISFAPTIIKRKWVRVFSCVLKTRWQLCDVINFNTTYQRYLLGAGRQTLPCTMKLASGLLSWR